MSSSILVSWISKRHDPFYELDGNRTEGPSLQLLFDRQSPLRGEIRRFYVLAHEREKALVEELVGACRDRGREVEVIPRFFDEDVPPTDHERLFVFTATTLREVRRANPRLPIMVNLSPGTPAMHTALLLSLQARLAGDTARAFQGIPPKDRKPGEGVAREVAWNLLSQLSAALPDDDDDFGRSPEWSLSKAKSAQLREVAAAVRRFAAVPYPVLFIGPRGTGKSHIARELRDYFRELTVQETKRWDFHLNCAEFVGGDPNILRSALFGHEENAFSGASKGKQGLLERASTDCVFLDEIHHLDRHAQGMLLLALQREGTFRRLGGEHSIKAQFRLLAATNVTLAELRDKLNADFLDRISDLVIPLPALRECREDLGGVWLSVLTKACRELLALEKVRHGLGIIGSAEHLLGEFRPHQRLIEQGLAQLQLPGNYRDLEKLARRLLVAGFAGGQTVFTLKKQEVETQLERLRTAEQAAEFSTSSDNGLAGELPTEARCQQYFRELHGRGASIDGQSLIGYWRQRIFESAIAVAGNKSSAARMLQMNVRTFTERVRAKPA